jgi:hypothetical protein
LSAVLWSRSQRRGRSGASSGSCSRRAPRRARSVPRGRRQPTRRRAGPLPAEIATLGAALPISDGPPIPVGDAGDMMMEGDQRVDVRWSAGERNAGRRWVPAAVRSAAGRRAIETTRTPASTRSHPRSRTTHRTGSAPWRHQRRRRVLSQPVISRMRPRSVAVKVRVYVSIANPKPVGAIAMLSMSPRPCQGSEWRSRQPSASSDRSARWTASSDCAPTLARAAS